MWRSEPLAEAPTASEPIAIQQTAWSSLNIDLAAAQHYFDGDGDDEMDFSPGLMEEEGISMAPGRPTARPSQVAAPSRPALVTSAAVDIPKTASSASTGRF